MFDIKKIMSDAQQELTKEYADKAKLRIKEKLKQIAQAEQVSLNLQRELEDLYQAISEGN